MTPDDLRSRYWSAIAQPYYLALAGRSTEALTFAEQALDIATRAGSPNAIAFALHVRGLAHRNDPELAREDFDHALNAALNISATHIIVDAALMDLAALAAMQSEELTEALQVCRHAIETSVTAHYMPSLSLTLQSTAIVLVRAGDPDTAARILRSTRRHGHRTSRKAETAVTEALGPDALIDRPGEQLSMLETGRLALDAIDTRLDALERHTP